MAGLYGLTGYLTGQATGKHDAYLDALKNAQTQADSAERKREFDATYGLEAATAKASADKAALESETATRNRAFESGLKLPGGFGKLTPEQQIAYLNQRLNAAQAAGDDTVAEQTRKWISDLSLQTQRFANAAYTSGAKTSLTNAQADKEHAEAYAIRDLPARAREIAAGHDQAAWQRETARIAASRDLAQYNGNVRMALAQYAGAQRVAGMEYNSAVRAAIDQYNQGMETYRAQTSARNALLNPQAAAGATQPGFGMPPAPTINYTIQAPQMPNSLGGPLPPLPINRGNAQPRASAKPPTPVLSTAGQKAFKDAQDALKSAPLQDVIKAINDPRVYPTLTPGDREAIIKAIDPQGQAAKFQAGGFGAVIQGAGGSPSLPF